MTKSSTRYQHQVQTAAINLQIAAITEVLTWMLQAVGPTIRAALFDPINGGHAHISIVDICYRICSTIQQENKHRRAHNSIFEEPFHLWFSSRTNRSDLQSSPPLSCQLPTPPYLHMRAFTVPHTISLLIPSLLSVHMLLFMNPLPNAVHGLHMVWMVSILVLH